MPRARSPERDRAYQLWLDSGKTRELKSIAEELGVSPSLVRKWKAQDKWSGDAKPKKKDAPKRKRGGQPGNTNAAGQFRNKKAQKYGFLSKYLPDETKEIFDAVEKADPVDLLWQQIQIQYAAIIRAQKIAYVKDQLDKTKEISMENFSESGDTTAYDIQQAWEKQAAFLKAQSTAMSALANMLRHYDQMLRDRGDAATEEQRLRLNKLKAETDKLKAETDRIKSGQGTDDDDMVLKFIEGMKNDKPDA